MKTTRTFTRGRMNKELDERLIPDGEYIHAENITVGSTEQDEMGVVENARANELLVTPRYNGVELSNQAVCIGSFADEGNDVMYWFVHDPAFTGSPTTAKLDLVLSYSVTTGLTEYHLISMDDGGGVNTTLNFNPQYLITGVDKIDNLLFFTDNYNQPRRINVTTGYPQPSAGNIDQFTNEEILVIKRPPSESPTVTTEFSPNSDANYLEERFLCFGYRWRYADNEYSATSQFSKPAFVPKEFEFSAESYLNEGMVNAHNKASITFNTGSHLVKGIDVLFKDAADSTIKIIEKLDKEELGIGDNNNYTIDFTDSKIFTILPETEILRLYDNVPRLAQASTIMGNRLMYGNYLEGYDLKDIHGNPTRFLYRASRQTVTFGSTDMANAQRYYGATTYTINPAVSTTLANSIAYFDFSQMDTDNFGNSTYTAGTTLVFTFELDHRAFTTDPASGSTPSQENVNNQPFTLTFEYTLPTTYTSLADVVASPSWDTAIGTASTIKPLYNPGGDTSCDGLTFTDQFNCELQDLGAFSVYASGITGDGQPIQTSVTGTVLYFIFPALRLVDDPTAITKSVYELFGFNTTGCTMVRSTDRSSLHSNRGYETGIVYMDEYNRSTTAYVSPTNTIHVPCRRSDYRNQIRVEIPPGQLAPAWATRYKFVVKPDREKFNTIYANIAFIEAGTSNKAYILLEGENAQKVKEGDRLIVKRDMSGDLNSCVYVTVLEKKAISAEEAEVIDPEGLMPSGVYMVIKDSAVDFTMDADSIVDYGWITEATNCDKSWPVIWYPVNYITGSTGTDYTIPANSRITLEFEISREGRKSGAFCGNYTYKFNETFISNNTYDNFRDWWNDSNIGGSLNTGSWGDSDPAEISQMTYISTLYNTSLVDDDGTCCDKDNLTGGGQRAWGKDQSDCQIFDWLPYMSEGCSSCMFMAFIREGGAANDPLYLGFRGGKSCGNNADRTSNAKLRIRIVRAQNLFIFETEPQDANPDLFYEGAQSYSIDTATGFHNGNVQNQTATQNAIIDLDFANCFTFGNGAESYRIRDSIVGKEFNLGNRATSTAAKDFKEVRRGADITYSGVYNQESNVNKTNEFNLGIFNFKPLEQLFGSVQKLFARETDVLVLQQDKISYVLAGKNLLSDAAGGGTIASVPEVLGTQIARIEEYGISNNPESFAVYGADKYFTDTQRGAVLKLTGSGANNDTLTVISDANMSTWFRDAFNVGVETQKLGGYDRYADEYVLSISDRPLPSEEECIKCGTTISIALDASNSFTYSYCVIVGQIAENFTVDYDWDFTGGGETFEVSVLYDAATTTTGAVATPGSLTVTKTSTKPTVATVTLTSTTPAVVYATVNCPVGTFLRITQVCVTSYSQLNDLIHNEFQFTQGSYTSPVTSPQVQFGGGALINPVVSQYQTYGGLQGQGIFPSDGSLVTVQSNKYGTDNFTVSDPPHKMYYLRTNTTYSNTPADITNLLTAATNIPLSGTSPVVGGTFTMPAGTDTNLYLVYDYRDKQSGRPLCYDSKPAPAGIEDACCGCTPSGTYYLNGPNLMTSTAIYSDAALTTGAANGFYQEGGVVREQTGAPGLPILGPTQSCPSCLPVCGVDTSVLTLGDGGLYKMQYLIGNATGAVIIKYTPNSVPNGIKVRYNAVNFFKVSSQTYGKLESTAANYTLCGTNASSCINSYPLTSNYNVFDWTNDEWIYNPTPQSATLAAGDNQLQTNSPGNCVMVIPKPLVANGYMDIEILTPCTKARTTWQVEVLCPAALPGVTTTAVEATHLGACGAALGTTHYFVTTDGTTTGPELHAFVFTDVNGATPAADGYIKYIGPQSYQIQDGIIIALTGC